MIITERNSISSELHIESIYNHMKFVTILALPGSAF